MGKNIRVELFKYDDEYRLTVYIGNAYYTQHKSQNLKQLCIDAHEYLTADL